MVAVDRQSDTRPRDGSALSRLVVDAPGSLGGRARARRWRVIRELFPEMRDMTVVDLGGTTESWLRAPVRPDHVTVVNLLEPGQSDEPWLQPVLGDACNAQAVLKASGAPVKFDLFSRTRSSSTWGGTQSAWTWHTRCRLGHLSLGSDSVSLFSNRAALGLSDDAVSADISEGFYCQMVAAGPQSSQSRDEAKQEVL